MICLAKAEKISTLQCDLSTLATTNPSLHRAYFCVATKFDFLQFSAKIMSPASNLGITKYPRRQYRSRDISRDFQIIIVLQ